jgi:ADP-ribose pyrophosphatase YjhB (NUDIX family)
MSSPEPDDFPRPIATVDLCIFALGEEGLNLLLTRRAAEPFAGEWSLPGGFVHAGEDAGLDAAAARVLHDKTGFVAPYLEQLQTFGGASRDPRGWSLSVAYMALVPADQAPAAGLNTAEAVWQPVAGQGVAVPLAFDHAAILGAALARLSSKVEYSTLPAHLLPVAFTLSELQSVYERLLGRPLEKSAFRKRMAEADFVEPIEGEMRRASNRPAQLYRLKQAGGTTLFDRLL